MVVGFNHNIRYKGEVFHVQTEDSGINSPCITTLLYRNGTIIASLKTSYADIVKVEMLGKVVEDIMKEQHKDILRRLKAGEFDARAFPDRNSSVPEPKDDEHSSPPARPEQAPQFKQSLDEVILDYLASEGDK